MATSYILSYDIIIVVVEGAELKEGSLGLDDIWGHGLKEKLGSCWYVVSYVLVHTNTIAARRLS